MGCTGSISKPCGDGPQWELESEWHLAQPMGRLRGIPSLTGQHAYLRSPLLRQPVLFLSVISVAEERAQTC